MEGAAEDAEEQHSAERVREAARASSAAEAERTAAEERISAMREQMQSVQASLQAELEWRSSEMEGWGSRFAAEREGLLEQLRVEREAAAAVRAGTDDLRSGLAAEEAAHQNSAQQLVDLHALLEKERVLRRRDGGRA